MLRLFGLTCHFHDKLSVFLQLSKFDLIIKIILFFGCNTDLFCLFIKPHLFLLYLQVFTIETLGRNDIKKLCVA